MLGGSGRFGMTSRRPRPCRSGSQVTPSWSCRYTRYAYGTSCARSLIRVQPGFGSLHKYRKGAELRYSSRPDSDRPACELNHAPYRCVIIPSAWLGSAGPPPPPPQEPCIYRTGIRFTARYAPTPAPCSPRRSTTATKIMAGCVFHNQPTPYPVARITGWLVSVL